MELARLARLGSRAAAGVGESCLAKQLGTLLHVISFKGVVVWCGDHFGLQVHG